MLLGDERNESELDFQLFEAEWFKNAVLLAELRKCREKANFEGHWIAGIQGPEEIGWWHLDGEWLGRQLVIIRLRWGGNSWRRVHSWHCQAGCGSWGPDNEAGRGYVTVLLKW